MTTDVGLWIDHRGATIVTLTGQTEAVKHIASQVEKHVRSMGSDVLASGEDVRDRRLANEVNQFLEDVIGQIRGADTIYIFGPGEAKGELAKRLAREHLGERIDAVEAADKLTERQIAARVREHFLN